MQPPCGIFRVRTANTDAMKHLFSFHFGNDGLVGLGPNRHLSHLQINAEGAADEDIVVVTLETQPAMLGRHGHTHADGRQRATVMFGVPMEQCKARSRRFCGLPR